MKPILFLILVVIGIIIYHISNTSWLDKAQERNEAKFKNANQNIIDASKARTYKENKDQARKRWLEENGKKETTFNRDPKWYPTGWMFNEKTQLWEAPDYMKPEKPPIKKLRTEPTYEEWKAAREAEQNKDKSTN